MYNGGTVHRHTIGESGITNASIRTGGRTNVPAIGAVRVEPLAASRTYASFHV